MSPHAILFFVILFNVLNAFNTNIPPTYRIGCTNTLSFFRLGASSPDHQFPNMFTFQLNGRNYILEKDVGGWGIFGTVRFGFDARDTNLKVAVKTLNKFSEPFSVFAEQAYKSGNLILSLLFFAKMSIIY